MKQQSVLPLIALLLSGNPLDDISVLHDVLVVMSNGQFAVKRIPFALKSE